MSEQDRKILEALTASERQAVFVLIGILKDDPQLLQLDQRQNNVLNMLGSIFKSLCNQFTSDP